MTPFDGSEERPAEKPEPISVRVTGWRNWGDHPYIIGATLLLTLVSSVFALAQFIRDEPAGPAPAGGTVQEQGCAQIVGRWDWLSTGGVVAFTEDGQQHWYRVPSDPLPMANGTWVCQDRTPVHFTLSWIETSLVDTLVLTDDGQRLVGETLANNFQLSATRTR